jgi:hypothetical protein
MHHTCFGYTVFSLMLTQCCGSGMISSRIWLNFIPDPGYGSRILLYKKKGKNFKTAPKDPDQGSGILQKIFRIPDP